VLSGLRLLPDIIIMSKVQYNRAPCPGRIFEDLGNGFAIGCAGGTLFYFFKGKSWWLWPSLSFNYD
jgi:hypothetical protein